MWSGSLPDQNYGSVISKRVALAHLLLTLYQLLNRFGMVLNGRGECFAAVLQLLVVSI